MCTPMNMLSPKVNDSTRHTTQKTSLYPFVRIVHKRYFVAGRMVSSLSSSDAYRRLWNGSILVQIMSPVQGIGPTVYQYGMSPYGHSIINARQSTVKAKPVNCNWHDISCKSQCYKYYPRPNAIFNSALSYLSGTQFLENTITYNKSMQISDKYA